MVGARRANDAYRGGTRQQHHPALDREEDSDRISGGDMHHGGRDAR